MTFFPLATTLSVIFKKYKISKTGTSGINCLGARITTWAVKELYL